MKYRVTGTNNKFIYWIEERGFFGVWVKLECFICRERGKEQEQAKKILDHLKLKEEFDYEV